MGKEKWEALRNDEALLYRTSYHIAAERNIRPIDVIQALQVSLGINNGESLENEEGLPRTMTEILKHALMPSTWRRKLYTIARQNAERFSVCSYEATLAEMERVCIEVVKEVCSPKREKVERKRS